MDSVFSGHQKKRKNSKLFVITDGEAHSELLIGLQRQ